MSTMKEIIKINLDNEMDLILAHKRCMKIAEMCGMASSFQTRFSTAVSEVARCSIAKGKDSLLVLGINIIKATQKEIVAIITDTIDLKAAVPKLLIMHREFPEILNTVTLTINLLQK